LTIALHETYDLNHDLTPVFAFALLSSQGTPKAARDDLFRNTSFNYAEVCAFCFHTSACLRLRLLSLSFSLSRARARSQPAVAAGALRDERDIALVLEYESEYLLHMR